LALLSYYSGIDFTKFLNILLVGFSANKRKLCEERDGENNNKNEKVENEIETAALAPDLGVSIYKGPEAISTEMARQSLSDDLAHDDCNENDIGRLLDAHRSYPMKKRPNCSKNAGHRPR